MIPPSKFNIAPEKWWLEDYFPIGKVTFQHFRGYVKLREGILFQMDVFGQPLTNHSAPRGPEACQKVKANFMSLDEWHTSNQRQRVYGKTNRLAIITCWLVVSTHLKNMIVKLDHETPGRVEHKKCLKPPPSLKQPHLFHDRFGAHLKNANTSPLGEAQHMDRPKHQDTSIGCPQQGKRFLNVTSQSEIFRLPGGKGKRTWHCYKAQKAQEPKMLPQNICRIWPALPFVASNLWNYIINRVELKQMKSNIGGLKLMKDSYKLCSNLRFHTQLLYGRNQNPHNTPSSWMIKNGILIISYCNCS